ncbi:Phosphoesterase, PA-phosphatase related protein [Rhodobacterales bacterium HTCC2150]|nr:Phosphoesterase, PA-phosphatase related protein [Rhodobacterales bacterium HTCC2150] [Rhodobacteraceae bacterium HTCC2150]
MSLSSKISQRSIKISIILILILTVLVSEKRAERYGDNFQIVLPLMALGCNVVNGSAGEYFVRYLGMFFTTHGFKRGLGEIPLNTRPNGKTHGFPSGHTSTAVFGASSLVSDCITSSPIVKGVVIVTAGFVGASRIESENHNIWQVLAGVLVGWFWDRAARKPGPVRRIALKLFSPIRRGFHFLTRPLTWLINKFSIQGTNK